MVCHIGDPHGGMGSVTMSKTKQHSEVAIFQEQGLWRGRSMQGIATNTWSTMYCVEI